MLTFGPVPSRRLGRSLGINNIPPKICSYDCCYCQVGRTTEKKIQRSLFYRPEAIRASVQKKLDQAVQAGEKIDTLTFVPDGEPTLDENLDRAIAGVRPFGLPVAVISNASLVTRPEVREALQEADWISLKVDAVRGRAWRRVNRPHRELSLPAILEGAQMLRKDFSGRLVTETMLVAGLNDGEEDLQALSRFLEALQPEIAYLSVPLRPPAEKWVRVPDENHLHQAYRILAGVLPAVELLIEFERGPVAFLGDPERALLDVLAVHPLSEEALRAMAAGFGSGKEWIEPLLERGEVTRVVYRGENFFLRRFRGRGG